MAQVAGDRIVVYVGGEAVGPDTIDPRSALELAASYIDMMQKIAEERDQELDLHGLAIVPGSLGLAMRSHTPKQARQAAREVDAILVGRSEPSTVKTERAYGRLVRAVESLPEGYWANVEVGTFKRPLMPVRAPVVRADIWASTTLRATAFKVGGAKPKVWFRSHHEERPFGVSTDVKTAREIAPHLYTEVEVTFRFVRDEDGAIDSAELESFRAIPELAPDEEVTLWRRWFAEAGAQWDSIDDVDAELSRGDAGDQ